MNAENRERADGRTVGRTSGRWDVRTDGKRSGRAGVSMDELLWMLGDEEMGITERERNPAKIDKEARGEKVGGTSSFNLFFNTDIFFSGIFFFPAKVDF